MTIAFHRTGPGPLSRTPPSTFPDAAEHMVRMRDGVRASSLDRNSIVEGNQHG
jgi:hypothetical protein